MHSETALECASMPCARCLHHLEANAAGPRQPFLQHLELHQFGRRSLSTLNHAVSLHQCWNTPRALPLLPRHAPCLLQSPCPARSASQMLPLGSGERCHWNRS
jgi:hypothetical protein